MYRLLGTKARTGILHDYYKYKFIYLKRDTHDFEKVAKLAISHVRREISPNDQKHVAMATQTYDHLVIYDE